jgi:hypothetical protein
MFNTTNIDKKLHEVYTQQGGTMPEGTDDDKSFTIVSYKKKAPSTALARSTRASTQKKNNTGTVVTLSNFWKFHYRVFPIIQAIVNDYKISNNAFIEKWRKITAISNPKVLCTSNFRTVSKALGLGATN